MTRDLLRVSIVALTALALASACGGETPAPPPPPEPVVEAPEPAAPDYTAALIAPTRLEGDAARDTTRKPAEVLAFSKILPGQTIFEIEAGGGYYTELLSILAGPQGKVIMQSPAEFASFYPDVPTKRLVGGRLANVTQSGTMFDKLEAADASVDVVTWFQGPHELWCKKSCGNLPMGEPAAVFAEIARILKPGGYFVVMDHQAKPGEATTSGEIHRIDAAALKPFIEAAGLTLEEESALLSNLADDHTKDVFDPSIAGKTDQFLQRYKKP